MIDRETELAEALRAAEADCKKLRAQNEALREALRNLITPDNFSVYATTDLIAAAVAALADHSRAGT